MYTYHAKLVRWVDGDTLLVEIDLGFYVSRTERIRLARIDAAELSAVTTYRQRQAKRAQAVGRKLCGEGSTITIRTSKSSRDMYARYIAEAEYEGVNLSDYLLERGVVNRYMT